MKTNNFFKRFCGAAMVALAMAMPLFTSCYDDSALNEKLEDIQNEVNQIKSDLAALQAAVDNDLSVVEYTEIEGGYELTMSDGSKIYLYNGKDGAAGANGANGANGTNGKDGAQGEKGEKGDPGEKGDKGDPGEKGDKGNPGENGNPGEKGDKGDPGENGDAFFESVELSEDGLYLVITLIDGTVYNLPMGGFNVTFTLTDAAKAALKAGDVAEIPYSIAGAAETDEVVVRVLAASNCEAVVLADKKVVEVTPGVYGEGYVDIYAINNTTGDIKAKTISFSAHTCEVAATVLYASPAGGDVEVPVSTSVEYTYETDAAWLTYVKTKALTNETLVFSAEPNTTANREAKVTLKVDGKVVATVTVAQKCYNPAWITDENGEPVQWQETFGLYKSGAESATRTYKNVFTFALSDDFSKGAYLIANMLYADSYFASTGQSFSAQGGVYYADVDDAGNLVLNRRLSENSYNFTEDVTITYDSEANEFSFGELYVGWVQSIMANNCSIKSYKAVVKVEEVIPEGNGPLEAFVGTWSEEWEFSGYGGTPDPSSTFEVSIVDGKLYFKNMFYVKSSSPYGQSAGANYYGELSADGTTILLSDDPNFNGGYGHASLCPIMDENYAPSTLAISVTSDGKLQFANGFNGYVSNYTATKQVKESPLEAFVGTWSEEWEFSGYGGTPDPSSTFEVSIVDGKLYFKNMFYVKSSSPYGQSAGANYYGELSADGTTILLSDDPNFNGGYGHASLCPIMDENYAPSTLAISVTSDGKLQFANGFNGYVSNYTATKN